MGHWALTVTRVSCRSVAFQLKKVGMGNLRTLWFSIPTFHNGSATDLQLSPEF